MRTLGDGGFFFLEGLGAQHGAQQARLGTNVAAHHHVLKRRHFGKQANVLEGAGNARLGHFVHRGGLVGLACQLKSAAIRGVQAGDHVEKRGLASTVGADQAIDLTTLNGDANIREGLQAAEALGDTCNLEHHIVGFFCHVLTFCDGFKSFGSGSCRALAQATGHGDAAA